jgi:hypothetical protein
MISPVEKSHHDPITHFQWLFSKTGTECVTTSTDGRALWWDTRKFSDGPVETLNITEGNSEKETLIGATVLEYNVEAGVHYLKTKFFSSQLNSLSGLKWVQLWLQIKNLRNLLKLQLVMDLKAVGILDQFAQSIEALLTLSIS